MLMNEVFDMRSNIIIIIIIGGSVLVFLLFPEVVNCDACSVGNISATLVTKINSSVFINICRAEVANVVLAGVHVLKEPG